MNRKERRKIMKKNPGYRKVLKSATKEAVNNLEEIFKQKWKEENDETLNDGEGDYDDGEDNIYND